VDKTFLGADAIHADGSIGNVNIEEVAIKQADESRVFRDLAGGLLKIFHDRICRVGTFSDVDVLITDAGCPEKMKAMIRDATEN
jgi:DeoR/GlpR family transcriptional regulator of sugar metabolism